MGYVGTSPHGHQRVQEGLAEGQGVEGTRGLEQGGYHKEGSQGGPGKHLAPPTSRNATSDAWGWKWRVKAGKSQFSVQHSVLHAVAHASSASRTAWRG